MFGSKLARVLLLGALTVAAFTVAPTVSVPKAFAATSIGCNGGNFKVTMPNGAVLSGDKGFKFAAKDVANNGVLQVRGKYVEFNVNVSTFSVYNYTLTGAANPEDLTGGKRTVLFASKVPDLKGATLNSGELEVTLSPQSLLLKRKAGISLKLQVKDCATGGIFQMEPETGAAINITHTLAPGIFYFKNIYTGKINFGNGTMLIGKDSPQVATRLYQDETTTIWSVASGGRMGGVLGEDAVELSAGATNCVQQCQAQNQIRGSLPITDPFFNN